MRGNIIPPGKRNLPTEETESWEAISQLRMWCQSGSAAEELMGPGCGLWMLYIFKCMQFLLYLLYTGLLGVPFPLKGPWWHQPDGISTTRGHHREGAAKPGEMFYTKVPSLTGTLLSVKGWTNLFSSRFFCLLPTCLIFMVFEGVKHFFGVSFISCQL